MATSSLKSLNPIHKKPILKYVKKPARKSIKKKSTPKSRRGHRMCAIHILGCVYKIEKVLEKDPDIKNIILYDAVVRNVQTLAESTRFIQKEIRFTKP